MYAVECKENKLFWLGSKRAWKVKLSRSLAATELLAAIEYAKGFIAGAAALLSEDKERLCGNAKANAKEVVIYLL